MEQFGKDFGSGVPEQVRVVSNLMSEGKRMNFLRDVRRTFRITKVLNSTHVAYIPYNWGVNSVEG